MGMARGTPDIHGEHDAGPPAPSAARAATAAVPAAGQAQAHDSENRGRQHGTAPRLHNSNQKLASSNFAPEIDLHLFSSLVLFL